MLLGRSALSHALVTNYNRERKRINWGLQTAGLSTQSSVTPNGGAEALGFSTEILFRRDNIGNQPCTRAMLLSITDV
jgi:hypothetical protein